MPEAIRPPARVLAALLALMCLAAGEVPALPNAGDDWDSDPWAGAGPGGDPLVDRTAEGGYRLGPFRTGGEEWYLETDRPRSAAAMTRVTATGSSGDVPVQRFHRRLVVGPVCAGEGTQRRAYWVLLRDGRVRFITQHGDPTFFADELAFDISFDDIDLSGLSAADRASWVEGFWEREARIWERADRDDDGREEAEGSGP